MKKFITLLLTGTMLLSMPVLANDDDNYIGDVSPDIFNSKRVSTSPFRQFMSKYRLK